MCISRTFRGGQRRRGEMPGMYLPSCVLITLALCALCNAEFNESPPDDITAAAGQTVRLHWEYPQNSTEMMTIALTKHASDDIAFTMECINDTDKGVFCKNATGYATIIFRKANKIHQGRYDLALTNGFKERKFFNIHIVDLNTTLLDGTGDVVYSFSQLNASDTAMHDYSIMDLAELELNCFNEYTLILEMGDSEPYNVACFILHSDHRDYSVHRTNQSEVRYDFYTFPSLVNRPTYLACEVSRTLQQFLLRHRVHVRQTDASANPKTAGPEDVLHSHFVTMYILVGAILVLAVILVCHSCHTHPISQSKWSVKCCSAEEQKDRINEMQLVPKRDVLLEDTGKDIIAVIKDLKQQINQFSHLKDERTIQMLSALHHMCKPKQRTLSDRAETDE